MAEFTCYVDESGDEGFSFNKGSLEWHIVAGVLIRSSEREQVVSAIAEYQDIFYGSKLMRPHGAPHWVNMKDRARHIYAKTINTRNIRLFVIAFWKTQFSRAQRINQSGHLYRYGLKLLAEKASWFAADHNGDLHFVFADSQSAKKTDIQGELTSALSNKRRWMVEHVFNPLDIEISTPEMDNMLCFSDALASAFGNALNPIRSGKNKGKLEPAYSKHFVPNLAPPLRDRREHKIKVFPDHWMRWWRFMSLYPHAEEWF